MFGTFSPFTFWSRDGEGTTNLLARVMAMVLGFVDFLEEEEEEKKKGIAWFRWESFSRGACGFLVRWEKRTLRGIEKMC